MNHPVTGTITVKHKNIRKYFINIIYNEPCIAHYNYKNCCYLLTDFSKNVFGYDLCQPNNSLASLAAMECKLTGGRCEFLLPNSELKLLSSGFVSLVSRGREAKISLSYGRRLFSRLSYSQKLCQALGCPFHFYHWFPCIKLYIIMQWSLHSYPVLKNEAYVHVYGSLSPTRNQNGISQLLALAMMCDLTNWAKNILTTHLTSGNSIPQ